jgi:3-hydroxy-9,10-secoandrosta-1,3,5(10)-triene-9,17-dione monooxygenase reductase component
VSTDCLQMTADDRPPLTISSERYRDVLGHFITGVVAVTGMHADGPAGFTCQSFTSLSLDPPLVLLCASKVSTSWPKVSVSGRFAVNLLAHDQSALARRFAVSGGDKFEGVSWSVGRFSGAPMLPGTLGWLECEITTVHEAGDHWIVVSRVLDLAASADRQPLTFFRGTLADCGSQETLGHLQGAGVGGKSPSNKNEEGIEAWQKQ